MTDRKKIRVAIVGLGFGTIWVNAYQGHPDVEYIGLCDLNEERLNEIADRDGVERRHTDFNEILNSDDYDAVHLLTPIPLHVEQTLAVLEAGKHCACAIPMAIQMEDLQRIVDAQKKSGRNYMLMETELYSRAFLHCRNLQAAGRFGTMRFLSGYHYQNMEGWPGYWQGLPAMYYSYHALGPILEITGKRAKSVRCVGSGTLDKEEQGNYGNPYAAECALFSMEKSDLAAEITCSFARFARAMAFDRFNVYGDRMSFESAQIKGEAPAIHTLNMAPLPEGKRGRPITAVRVPLPELHELVPEAIRDFTLESKQPRGIPCAHEFIRSIIEERPARVDAVKAAGWTAAALCAHESALKSGEAIEIPAFE